ncbi:MAG TPA: oligosaccharide flippase family protein [Hanamia sp.]
MSKLIKNWSYLLFSDLGQLAISFFVFMFLARKLSPEGYGTLNAIFALASLFSVFAMSVSSNQVIIREVTLHPKATRSIFKIVLPIRIASLLLSLAVLIAYQFYAKETQPIILVGGSFIVLATLTSDLAESLAFGHFVTKFTTVLSIGAAICWLSVVVLLPSSKIYVEWALLFYSLIYLIQSFAYLGISFKKFVRPNREESKIGYKTILLMSMPYLWIRTVGVFSDQVPVLLLKGYSGAAEVGFYAVGNRLVLPITIAVSTGLRALFPFMTKLYSEDKERFIKKLSEGFTFVLILGSTIAMFLTIFSNVWIPLLFGKAYDKSVLAFNYQAWLGVLLCFDLILANVLSATYRQKTLAIIMTIDILIVFPLMYIGAKYGAEGMAKAKLLGGLVTVLYHVIVVMLVLKARIKSLSFLLSCVYFITMMVVTIFISDVLIKLAIILILLITFIAYRNSPLRQLSSILYKRLNMKLNLKK